MHRILIFICVFIGLINSASAASFPFTDVLPSDNYYEGVKSLYDYGIITNNWDNLFRPNDPITRDVFVWLATSVSCKKCLIPSTEDIIRYQVSPFIDLKKSNPNYYCIAYASEKKIVQWYNIPNLDGTFTCQDNSNYSSPPFCDTNNTTRIEAVAMLLRQAWLWDDIKNTNYTPAIDITDVSTYWRWYAEKWIQAQILTVKDEKKVYPDEIINRWEFASMASKILAYNQCSPEKDTSSIASDMIVIDSSGKTIEKTEFDRWTSDALSVVWWSGNWLKKWTLTNPITGEVLNGNGDTYPLKDVGTGKWIAKVELIDPKDKQVVSTATSTIFIRSNEQESKAGLSVNIDGKPLAIAVWGSIDFSVRVYGWTSGLTYAWNFWDGNASNTIWNTRHTYNAPWSYRVTLTVTDRDGNTSQSTLIVSVWGNIDTDRDGIYDADDICPYVSGIIVNRWCPKIDTTNHGNTAWSLLAGIVNNSKVPDAGSSIISGIKENSCILGYQSSKWLVVGMPECDTCPCKTRVDILASMRSCDIIFPSILSPDQKSIYIRGWFYQLP